MIENQYAENTIIFFLVKKVTVFGPKVEEKKIKKKSFKMSQNNRIISELEKCYEKDDFKGGLKVATKHISSIQQNDIKSTVLAYKALFMQKLKQDKVQETIKEAIMLDMKNPIAWKINGMINKDLNDYTKAQQCYTQSYRLNPKDETVVKELSYISLMNQNYPKYLEYVRDMMKFNSLPSTIIAYVVGTAMVKKYDLCIKYLNTFESGLGPATSQEEMVFRDQVGRFHANLLIKNKEYEECLTYLSKQLLIRDRITMLEDEAICYENLDNKEKMLEKVHELLKEYPDNGDYFAILERNMEKDKYVEELYKIKDTIKSKYAHVRILEIIPLEDEHFMPLLEEQITPLLKKGSPAIYATIADFTPEKLTAAFDFINKQEVGPAVKPIVHVFNAQYYLNRKEYEKGVAECDEGIKINPTVVELYVTKTDLLQRAGKEKEALQTAEILSRLDPADKNSNNLYVRMLYRNGFMRTARIKAEPFNIDQKKNSKLFKNEFNKLHFRAARCALRGGDVENALNFYKDSFNHFTRYINNQFTIMGWATRRPMSLYEMQQWSEELVNHKQKGKAFTNIARLLIQKNDMKELKDYVSKMMLTKNQEALSYMCVYFALSKQPLLALKCYLKLEGAHLILATPAMKHAAKDAETIEGLAKDVFFEEYKEKAIDPQTSCDYLALARGHLYMQEIEQAKECLNKAAALEMSFPTAVDIDICAKIEMKDEAFAQQIVNKIHEKYPMYEVEYEKYEEDEPHPFIQISE